MKTIPNQTKIILEAVERLRGLAQGLQSWNLVSGLYSEASTPEEDLVHALSWEARSLVLQSLKLAFQSGLAGINGKAQGVAHLLARLDGLGRRLETLETQCRKAMASCPEEEESRQGDMTLKAFAEKLCQRKLARSEKALFFWWQRNGYLDDLFQPTHCARRSGLFSLKHQTVRKDGGEPEDLAMAMVTPAGQQYFSELFLESKAGKEAA